jgi:prepilin-type N-terminal cleavage/methylation domain-containing protein
MVATKPTRRHCTKSPASGLTLVELLLTIAVLGVLAAILIPQLSGDLPERLSAAAQVVASDLDYARSLAVANNSTYRLVFDPANNRYQLRHSGTAAQFDTLPASPYRQNDDPVTQQTTNLATLPIPEPGVRLLTVLQMQAGGQATNQIEFNGLGGTTTPHVSIVWLGCGRGALKRFIPISVDPITGLVTIGAPVAALPSTVSTIVQQQTATEAEAVQTGI